MNRKTSSAEQSCYSLDVVPAFVRSLGLVAGCTLSWACSLYNESLLSLEQGSSGAGANAGGGAGAFATSGGVSAGKAGANLASGGGAGTVDAPAGGGKVGGGAGGSAGQLNAAGDDSGSGGMSPLLCKDHPIPVKASWTATASHSSLGEPAAEYFNPPEFVHDRTDKRWATGKPQAGDEWLQVDFGSRASVSQLWFTLRAEDHDDYARIYEIRISDTALDFDAPVVTMGGGVKGPEQLVELPVHATGRYLLLTQQGKAVENWWSISELTAECID